MKKEEFGKLFKNMYTANPKQWDKVLEAKRNYSGSKKSEKNYSKQNRQAMTQESFKKLLRLDYDQFQDFSRKADTTVNKPKSIRINGETLQKNKDTNQRNKNADTSFVDSSAVDSFSMKDNGDGTKDVTIVYTSGNKDYLYPDVPKNIANAFYAAPSKGSFAYRVISNYSDYSNPKVQQKIREGK